MRGVYGSYPAVGDVGDPVTFPGIDGADRPHSASRSATMDATICRALLFCLFFSSSCSARAPPLAPARVRKLRRRGVARDGRLRARVAHV